MQPRLLTHPARLAGASLLRLQSDERLVALAREGHVPAFEAIVDRHRPALLRYAGRIAGDERAEDALQQALVNAHRSLTADDARPIDLRPWLYRIVHNVSLNLLRGARDDLPLDEAAAAPAGAGDAADVAMAHERLRAALGAVAALPVAQRDAILLRELDGRSHDEIATALGVTPGAARQHLFRARATLRGAITALTPQPLLARLLEAGSGHGSEVATAGLGLGVVGKAGASLLTVAALAGGTVGTRAVVEHHDRHRSAPAAARPAAPPATTPEVASRVTAATPLPAHAEGARSGHGSESGPGSGHAESGDDHGGAKDAHRARGSSDDHGSGSGSSGKGSGSSGSSGHSGGDDSGSSGSGGDDSGSSRHGSRSDDSD